MAWKRIAVEIFLAVVIIVAGITIYGAGIERGLEECQTLK